MLKHALCSLAVVVLAACAKSAPPDAPADTAAPPVATPGDTAAPGTTPPAAGGNKCTDGGGNCTATVATVACKKFEQGPEWGCGANEGCCLQ